MLDSHAHIGDISYKDGLVCSSSPEEVPIGYRFNAIGLLPESHSCDIDTIENYVSKGYLVGEIGLDKRYGSIDEQLSIFKSCLSIAKKYNRFVSIHMVGYAELTYNTLRDLKIDNFLIHNYTGSYDMAKRFMSIGGLVSISNRARKAKSFMDIIKLPFVTETDMRMSKEQHDTLSEWNKELSKMLDKDIERISEELLSERLI